jgi:flavin-dependent dehydrogenase
MGLVKVLTGEGIYYAMKSGKIAGQILSHNRNDLKNKYKEKVKPLIKDVFLIPYIPPKIFTLTFWKLFFNVLKGLNRFGKNSNSWNFLLKIFMDKATHRKTNSKESYYYKENIKKINYE